MLMLLLLLLILLLVPPTSLWLLPLLLPPLWGYYLTRSREGHLLIQCTLSKMAVLWWIFAFFQSNQLSFEGFKQHCDRNQAHYCLVLSLRIGRCIGLCSHNQHGVYPLNGIVVKICMLINKTHHGSQICQAHGLNALDRPTLVSWGTADFNRLSAQIFCFGHFRFWQ